MKKYFLFALLAVFLVGCDQPIPDDPSNGDSGSATTPSAVVTGEAKDITHRSVVLYGEVNVEVGDYESIEWGMMYSKDKAELESRNGQRVYSKDALLETLYSVSLSGLDSETKYYYCAFLYLNGKQYKFGKTQEFSTLVAPGVNEISILTGSAEDITYNSVALYGELEVNMSDYTSVQYGISYSTNKKDLQSNTAKLAYSSETLQGSSYSVSLSGLDSETQYYYCAFVYVNDKDYKYGSIKSFTTLEAPEIKGIGTFSVSATKQVTFSSGNVQYHPANNEWRFAESQLDYIGNANGNISSTYNGWIDLFGWSTSTTNFGVSTSTSSSNYSGSFVDWGTNQIGSDAPNTWRTLTYGEWNYLRNGRPNASSLRGVAQVNGVNGLIFLPDNWTCPAGVTFKSGFHTSNGVDYYAAYQTFTADQWAKLEAAGAIFLPAAGRRNGTDVGGVQSIGYYWSATENDSFSASCLRFNSDEASMVGNDRYRGLSVRLVKDL